MKHRLIWKFVLVCCLTVLFALPVFANSAEPPCLTIVVVSAPDDLELALVDEGGAEAYQLRKRQFVRGWETYFRFTYSHVTIPGEESGADDVDLNQLRLAVTTGGNTTLLELPDQTFDHYNNVLQFDCSDMTLQTDLYAGRMILIIGMRVILTLLIEGILFWAFGYRQKHSWCVVLCFNAMTQLALNLILGGATMDSYILFGYYLLEAAIVVFEALAYWNTLKEKRGRSIPYALCANAASLVIGALMIENLPLAL
jgi:hypothetical protein